ncbi:homogentisate phytyltransferase 1, chloroplastic-like isoform X1 [Salvia splendens]|uniref:homogentisate phytyltransferase 1, chloroplastic-like isoform X1 n=1 Tax=Salvia splendens TaxID=180675 RepID=UPI001C268AB8|nr:homogentisate phytyltransferase 1, chloroplastic-like isoform X1 [Salvia splendens]
MESMLIGSFQKPTLSFPFAAELCSLPTAGNNLICKDFSTVGRLYSLPERLCVRRRNLMHQPVKNIAQRRITLNPKGDSKYVANSSSGHSLESEPSKSPLGPVQQAFDAFYRFSRPHTVIGTALSIVSVSLLAVEKVSDFSPLFFAGLLEAIIAALLMNIYIVGLNQISDIEIDKVNKPYLPLASGEYSLKTGVLIVSSFGILSFWLGWVVGSWPLFWALFISFMLGTAYSIDIPLLRWKRFAVVAAMCIFAVRAVIVQIAFYLHIQTYVFGRPGTLTKPVIFATAFMSFFSVVIALFKDIPDIVGDKIYGIQSFTVRLGQEKVFWICISLLEMAYAVALFVGITSCCTWSKWVTVIGHTVLGYLLWRRAKCIDFKNKAAITSFYMFIWKLFYAEYLLIPLVR